MKPATKKKLSLAQILKNAVKKRNATKTDQHSMQSVKKAKKKRKAQLDEITKN